MNKPTKSAIITMMPGVDIMPVSTPPQPAESQPGEKLVEIIQEKPPIWKLFDVNRIFGVDRTDWYSKIYNLLFSLDEIAGLFSHEIEHKSWLNAFLFAAGMNQIVEDYLNDPGILGKAANTLRELPKPFNSFFTTIITAIYRLWTQFQEAIGDKHKIIAWNNILRSLVGELSELVIGRNQSDPVDLDHIVNLSDVVSSGVRLLPIKLRSEIIRLPSCFISFDQQFEDFQHIIHDFSTRWPDRDRPLLLVGIRTAGNYLGPIYATLLKSLGYRKVSLTTIRPGKFSTNELRKASVRLKKNNGLALICDDPPITGSTLLKTIQMVEQVGILSDNIILLVQLFGDRSSLPLSLTSYQSILIPWEEWNIHRYLDPQNVEHVLTEACTNLFTIAEVIRTPDEHVDDIRQHIQALYQVKVIEKKTGAIRSHLVQVNGVGLGYFAEHALAVTQELIRYSTQMITLLNGLGYQDLGTESRLLSKMILSGDGQWTESIIEYILERNKKLSVSGDVSLEIYGRNAAWEVASNLLSKLYGRAWWLARKAFIDSYVKVVMKPSQPSIIDGDIGLMNWYVSDNGGFPLVKIHLTERDFSHKDLFSYDPIFDLASLDLEVQNFSQVKRIRQLYESFSGEMVSSERWMLYQLVRLWDMNRQKLISPLSISRKMAKVTQEYFSEIFFNDVQPATGPICALDVDGVLETHQLGFASLTKNSASSLRAMIQHGYRVLLATGRSLNEVKDRCGAYHLTGGVAEYGAILYDHTSGKSLSLLTEDEQVVLNQLRFRLSKMQGIWVDPDHQFSVRTYTIGTSGERMGLSDETIAWVLNDPGIKNQVYPIKGIAQTDFMVLRINKGVGLEEWLNHFDSASSDKNDEIGDSKPIALAVGDSNADIPMFRMASHAFAPAHADFEEDCVAYQVTSKPYQLGFSQAVTSFLGHSPNSCLTCQPATYKPETEFMLDLLSSQEDGLLNMLTQAFRLYTRKVR